MSRSRLTSLLFNRTRRFFTTAAAAAHAAASNNKSSSRKFLKYSLGVAVTGATASVGYLSFAYSCDEIYEKTKAMREASESVAGDLYY